MRVCGLYNLFFSYDMNFDVYNINAICSVFGTWFVSVEPPWSSARTVSPRSVAGQGPVIASSHPGAVHPGVEQLVTSLVPGVEADTSDRDKVATLI